MTEKQQVTEEVRKEQIETDTSDLQSSNTDFDRTPRPKRD